MKGLLQMKRITFILTSLMLCCVFFSPAYASENLSYNSDTACVSGSISGLTIDQDTLSRSSSPIVRANSDFFVEQAEIIKQMSIDELNTYIDNICKNISSSSPQTVAPPLPPITITSELKAAWLAAAQAARLAGYPCSATAIEHSVLGKNYTENGNGIFQQNIITTQAFKNYLSLVKNANLNSATRIMEFTSTDNKDLYYSLHNVTISMNRAQTDSYYRNYSVNIYDVFDFAIDTNYDKLFPSIINNWGWLSQTIGALENITININFIA